MDSYEYEQIDKEMAVKIDEIYSDPKRHRFYSEHAHNIVESIRGPRDGIIRGRKTVCAHCGNKQAEHADEDDAL